MIAEKYTRFVSQFVISKAAKTLAKLDVLASELENVFADAGLEKMEYRPQGIFSKHFKQLVKSGNSKRIGRVKKYEVIN